MYENSTDTTDANGIPAHSVAAVICGGNGPAVVRAIYVAVIILGFGLIKAIVSGVEAWKKISLRDRQILQTLSALQIHFITGNDHDKLRESNKHLVAYMNHRATRDAEEL